MIMNQLSFLRQRKIRHTFSLYIFLEEKSVTLKLHNKAGVVDFIELPYYHGLDRVLISGLDKLLKRNKLSPKVLKTYKIQGNLGQNSTSYKIASAFLQALKVDS